MSINKRDLHKQEGFKKILTKDHTQKRLSSQVIINKKRFSQIKISTCK